MQCRHICHICIAKIYIVKERNCAFLYLELVTWDTTDLLGQGDELGTVRAQEESSSVRGPRQSFTEKMFVVLRLERGASTDQTNETKRDV